MRVPDGYRLVMVEVSDQEWEQFQKDKTLLAAGTTSAAIRQRADMPERPIGIIAAERELKK